MSERVMVQFKDACPVVLNHLELYAREYDQIWRIVSLVQNNHDFFDNAKLADSCLKSAADKLEHLIKAHKLLCQPQP